MSLDQLWPSFPPERILHEDSDLVVVDKPPFVPTHAPERTDDIHRRLSRYYQSSSNSPVYLGIHQRLERDISGILVFTRKREANRSIAEQFERRRTKRTYYALVTATPGMPGRGTPPDYGTLRHKLVPVDNTHRVLPASAREGQPSTLSFRVLERKANRTLLAITPEPGCIIDLPAQLSAEGAPIVGDLERGGEPAHRLALHLANLVLAHPTQAKPLELKASIPSFFQDWLSGTDPLANPEIIARRLREAAERRVHIAHLPDTNAFRLANTDADGLPAVTIDRYADFLVVSLYDERSIAAQQQIFDAALSLGATGVYAKYRPRHASRIVDSHREEFAPKEPVRGQPAPDPLVVHELGLPFEVRLGDGLSTGVFLDQRENRKRVQEMAKGLSVANLFAYTGAFSVAAARGGAKSTVTVDVSKGVLEWARRNLDRIGADPEKHLVIEADVLKWLDHGAKRIGPFDLIILDPPSFATTKQTRFSAESDYKKLAAMAIRMLAPGGRLLACTNHKGIGKQKFRRAIQQAAQDAQRSIARIKDWPDPEDVPAEPGKEAQLKTVFVVLDSGDRR